MFEKSFPRTCKIYLKIVIFGAVFITQNGETVKWRNGNIFQFFKREKYIEIYCRFAISCFKHAQCFGYSSPLRDWVHWQRSQVCISPFKWTVFSSKKIESDTFWFPGKRIVTSFPNLTKSFLKVIVWLCFLCRYEMGFLFLLLTYHHSQEPITRSVHLPY